MFDRRSARTARPGRPGRSALTARAALTAMALTATAPVAVPGGVANAAPAAASAPAAGAASYAPATDGARITGVTWLGDREFDVSVESPDLGQTVQVRMLVPKGWSAEATRTWPVLYAFHGGADTYVSWTRSTDIEDLAAKYDVMVVMPEAASGSYTNWYNYGKGGTPRWEHFHLTEVRQLVERNFRAGTVRAAMGLSSGAQGAMTYQGRHPGFFRYVAAFSGIESLRAPGMPAMLMVMDGYDRDVDPFRIWGIPGVNDANWIAHDPMSLAPKLRGTGLYISSGTTGLPGPLDTHPEQINWKGYVSELAVGTTNLAFRHRLRQLKIPVTAHLYGNGTHSWPYWQREMHTVWPALMKAVHAKALPLS